MPTVYVTHEVPELNFTPAYRWGDKLVAIFPPRAGQITLSPQIAVARARKVLQGMRHDDFLVLVGDPVMIGLCVAVAAELLGRVKLLRWDKQTFEYIPIEIDFVTRHNEPIAATAS